MKIFYVQTRSKQVDWKNDSQLEKHKCNMNNKNQTKKKEISISKMKTVSDLLFFVYV